LWKDFQGRFKGIIDSLKKQRDFLDAEAASIHIVEAQESRLGMQDELLRSWQHDQEMLELTEKSRRIMQFQHSVGWLSVDEKVQDSHYDRILRRRHDKTCEWILGEPRMMAWLRHDSKSPLLWLSGKPGAGKCLE
jgi:hypothetical protein